MVDSTLQLVRGLVRPVSLFALVGTHITIALVGLFVPETRDYVFAIFVGLEGITLPVLLHWFNERKERHNNATDPDSGV